MAPLKSIKKDGADKRVQEVIDLASRLLRLLNERLPVPTNVSAQLDSLAQSFPPPKAIGFAQQASRFDELGSALWNAATFMVRDHNSSGGRPERTKLTVSLRTFAFLLLDAAHCSLSRRTKDFDQRVRIFRVALKAAKFCLDNHALDSAQKVLERCSEYADNVDDGPAIVLVDDDDAHTREKILKALPSEYCLLRVAHAWKSDRLDVADLFFTKIDKDALKGSRKLSEMAAEVFYEAGKSSLRKNCDGNATLWLDRARSTLDAHSLRREDHDFEDLRLTIVSSLIEALLKVRDQTGCKRAWDLTVQLGETHGLGNRLAVLGMQLKVIQATEPFDHQLAEALLLRMVQSAVLTEDTFRTVMHCIHKVSRKDKILACRALEQLIGSRILPDLDAAMDGDQTRDWIEKATTIYTMIITSNTDLDKLEAHTSLSSLFDLIHDHSKDVLTPRSTHALQTLIWKASGVVQGAEAQTWLELLRHPFLDGAGLINKARIGRKAMLTALDSGDLDKAREAFYSMPQAARDENTSRYVAYRLSLRSHDDNLASESLELLLKNSESNQKFLFACVLEAQQSNNRVLAVAALQAMLKHPPRSAHLPSLLRCTARLLVGELDNMTRELDEVAHEIIRVFETAASQTKIFEQGPEDQWRAEVQWWSKNAYNLTLRLCADIDPDHLVRLLRACIKFFELYPDDSRLMHRDDLARRKQTCHFLCCSALIVVGRSAQERQKQMQSYSDARREVASFMASWQPPTEQTDEANQSRTKGLEVLKFDVESVFKLEQWNHLDHVLAACLNFEGACQWETLADLIIIIHDQASRLGVDSTATSKIPQLLQKIINETWKQNKDVVKLARWLRVTFSIELGDADGDLSLKLVEQAARMAKRGADGPYDRYPEDELQWMATTAFNKAVDLLANEDLEGANAWIDGSLELARYADDNGSLHAHLTRNREEAERRMKQKSY